MQSAQIGQCEVMLGAIMLNVIMLSVVALGKLHVYGGLLNRALACDMKFW